MSKDWGQMGSDEHGPLRAERQPLVATALEGAIPQLLQIGPETGRSRARTLRACLHILAKALIPEGESPTSIVAQASQEFRHSWDMEHAPPTPPDPEGGEEESEEEEDDDADDDADDDQALMEHLAAVIQALEGGAKWQKVQKKLLALLA